jgi:putative ABC transport system substrate-binding protein
MRRGEFIILAGGAAAWPLAAGAQQASGMRRIGELMGYAENDSDAQDWVAAFREVAAPCGRYAARDSPSLETGGSYIPLCNLWTI